MIAGRIGAIERTLTLAAVEADQTTVRARAPDYAVPVDVASAHANSLLWNSVELGEKGLGVEAQEAGRAGENIERVPDRTVGRMWHHGVGAGARDPYVFARFGRLAGFCIFVDLAVGVGVEHERCPALRLGGIASFLPHLGIDPTGYWAGARKPQRVVGVIAELRVMRAKASIDEAVLHRFGIEHRHLAS